MLLRLSALMVSCAFVAFAPASRAQGAGGSGDPLVEARETNTWLTRINEAANKRNFQGTVVVSAGGTVASSRIAHFCEGRNQYERIDSLEGQMRNVLRQNDLVHTVWPQSRVAMVEQRDGMSSFPGLLQAGAQHVAEFYELKPMGVERVAGHEANVLQLRAKDAHRFGYRLWAEKTTGLLLRTEVLGEHAEVLESSAFSDVSINVKPQVELVTQPLRKLDGYRIVRPPVTATQLEAEGWTLKHDIPGFTMVSCVKRPFDGALRVRGAADPVLQAVYSDGLTFVSIFIEPFNAERHQRAMSTVIGATQTMMRRQGDFWVTVMGDVPTATLRAFAAGLERRK
jgi:sigma-E factor negative regulatory protein RseB